MEQGIFRTYCLVTYMLSGKIVVGNCNGIELVRSCISVFFPIVELMSLNWEKLVFSEQKI
jgi:hypothetical protein